MDFFVTEGKNTNTKHGGRKCGVWSVEYLKCPSTALRVTSKVKEPDGGNGGKYRPPINIPIDWETQRNTKLKR